MLSKLYIGVTIRVSEVNKSRGLWDALGGGGGGLMSGKGTENLQIMSESMCMNCFFSSFLFSFAIKRRFKYDDVCVQYYFL